MPLAQQPLAPLRAQLGQLALERLGRGAVEVDQQGRHGRWGAIAVPPELQQGFPAGHQCSGEVQQALEVVWTAELHPTLLEPQEQVDLIACDLRQPQPVVGAGAIDIEAPTQGRRVLDLLGVGQPQVGVVLELKKKK